MNIKPIPEFLLNDSFTLMIPDSEGFSEKEIRSVRVERTNSAEDSLSRNPRETTEIAVWYDCVNSSPETDFSVGMKILYRGETYEITKVQVFAADVPHHIKIKAVKNGGEYSEEG